MQTLKDVLEHQIKDLYSAESQLVKALPKMAEAATSADLRRAFEQHLRQTEQHVQRLKQAADQLGVKPTGEKCKGMEGLIREGEDLIEKHQKSEALDAALIAAAQRIEHYEIAGYGSAAQFAETLGEAEVKRLLGDTLEEEEATDEKLTMLAESDINEQAMRVGA